MEDTRHILLLSNALSESENISLVQSLKELRMDNPKLKISLLYVKPYFPTCYFHIPSMVTLSEEFEEEAKETLNNLGQRLNVTPEHQWIATGRVKPETLKIAATLGVDCILLSTSLHKELTQASLKKNRYRCPIKTIDKLKAA